MTIKNNPINTKPNSAKVQRYLALALGLGVLASSLAPAALAQGNKAKAAKTNAAKAKPRVAKKSLATLVVQGKITALTKAPRPGSVPYKDAITALHLVNVKPVQGKLTQSAIVVYVWGLRNNKLTPVASYHVGQTLKFSLQPWDKVEGKYGRYQRIELNDDATFNLDAFWGEAAK